MSKSAYEGIEVLPIKNSLTDLLSVNAARSSFNKYHLTFDKVGDTRLINYLVRHNHWSPLAHPHATIRVPYAMIDYDDLITQKTLIAGLNFKFTPLNKNLDRDLLITGSLWALLNLAKYLESSTLLDILEVSCPVSTEAFIKYRGIDIDHGWIDDDEISITSAPPAHVISTFIITAPIFVARQLVKHQVGMVWNEVSRRYVDCTPEIYYPDSWRETIADKKQGSGIVLTMDDEREAHYYRVVQDATNFYNSPENACICPEQRRMALPQSMMTTWMWTGTREAWNRVFDLRLKDDTQAETRHTVRLIQDSID